MVHAMPTDKEDDRKANTPGTPETRRPTPKEPIGLAALAGALAEWEDLDKAVEEIYAARRCSPVRPVR
jgi:hypothetical protein